MISKLMNFFKKNDETAALVEEKEELLERIRALEENQQAILHAQQTEASDQEDYKLTEKQRVYALSMIEKLQKYYVLGVEPESLTVKDLNRLLAYDKYKNRGALVNLEKKGVLVRKSS